VRYCVHKLLVYDCGLTDTRTGPEHNAFGSYSLRTLSKKSARLPVHNQSGWYGTWNR